MRYIRILVVLNFFQLCTQPSIGQGFAVQWIDSVSNYEGFHEIDKSNFNDLNFSSILSNQSRIENDPLSTYTGVFGPKFRRIDFYWVVSKSNSVYLVNGKSKLGENIQNLTGELRLIKTLFRKQSYISDTLFIGLFDCTLQGPGNKTGDGAFVGVFTLVFYLKNGDPQIFKTDSGDPPSFTNTFVGMWTQYNSDVTRNVIFSFNPAGLYERLPYCDIIYTYNDINDDYSLIKEEYRQFGWEDFDYKGRKSDWWK